MSLTPYEKKMIRHYVAQARDAHVRARNFASINHRVLSCAWRQRRNEYMHLARLFAHKA